MIAKFHYLTQNLPHLSHEDLALTACKSGVKWLQLRMKNKTTEERKAIALAVQAICKEYATTFILNDYPQLAKEIGADGVHLGKKDMPVKEARELLGEKAIIGGTANNLEDILALYHAGANYVGLGPFRFTQTKENLSPILGLEGYESLLSQLASQGINLPIIAIGGIQISDIEQLMKTGVHGIAVSSLINLAEDRNLIIKSINHLLL
ncbi:MAG: thiamine phosphate synthase [Bacteroidia bacterium]